MVTDCDDKVEVQWVWSRPMRILRKVSSQSSWICVILNDFLYRSVLGPSRCELIVKTDHAFVGRLKCALSGVAERTGKSIVLNMKRSPIVNALIHICWTMSLKYWFVRQIQPRVIWISCLVFIRTSQMRLNVSVEMYLLDWEAIENIRIRANGCSSMLWAGNSLQLNNTGVICGAYDSKTDYAKYTTINLISRGTFWTAERLLSQTLLVLTGELVVACSVVGLFSLSMRGVWVSSTDWDLLILATPSSFWYFLRPKLLSDMVLMGYGILQCQWRFEMTKICFCGDRI